VPEEQHVMLHREGFFKENADVNQAYLKQAESQE